MHETPLDAAAAIRSAFDFARRGQLQRAEEICGEVLRRHADYPEALFLRGVIEVQTGRTADAAASLHRYVKKDPARAAAHALLGDAQLTLGRTHEAVESYDAALRLDAGLVAAHHGRGNALLDLHRPREALVSYAQVLEFRPEDPEALFNLGNAQFQLNEAGAALESYQRAIAARPSYAAAHHNRGAALMHLRRFEAALQSFDAALAIVPGFPDALFQRACALRALRAWPDALIAFDRALLVRADHVETLVGRGDVLRELKRPADALADFERALRLRPNCVPALRGRGDALLDLDRPAEALAAHDAALEHGEQRAETLNSRGNSLRALRRFAEAVTCYDECLRLDPDNPGVHFNRGTALLRWQDREEQALTSYVRVLQLNPEYAYVAGTVFDLQRGQADWSVSAAAASSEAIIKSVLADAPVIAPFAFLSVSDSAAAQLACAKRFAADHCTPAASRPSNFRYGHERIRVAYVSSDFREHAASYLMIGVLEQHDRERFETFGISLRAAEESVMGERVKNAFDRFIDVSTLPDTGITALMRELEIDVAVDLGGYTHGFRPQIFSQRAAPVQVNYLGYPGTMGAPFMDYLLADDFVIPPGLRQYYSERIAYLPHCFQANDDRRSISDRPGSRKEQGLPTGAFVFCCFNNSHKINPAMLNIWMRLLARVPGAVLWLLGENSAARDNLRREAAKFGIAAGRLVFAERAPYAEHLSRLRLADLFLDTLPFNAGATASDALWAGLPLLTCSGEAFAARMAGSLLRALDVAELITFSLQEYEAKAAELSSQPHVLERLRARMVQNRPRAPLFDTQLFLRHLEAAYAEMWLRNERGLEPADISLSGIEDSSRRKSGPTNGA